MASIPTNLRLSPAPPALPADVHRLDFASTVDGVADYGYLWASPQPSTTWWIFVHGHGSKADQLWTRPDIARDWWPLAAKHRLNVLAVNLRGNSWMAPAPAADVHGLLAWLRTTYGAERFIFASGSMGGTSSLIYAALYPEDVAGVVGLCPATDLARYVPWCRARQERSPILRQIADAIVDAYGATPEEAPDLYARHASERQAARLTMPVYVVHGDADPTIPVTESRGLAAAMAGEATFRYVELPRGGHDTPLASMGEALAWILAKLDT